MPFPLQEKRHKYCAISMTEQGQLPNENTWKLLDEITQSSGREGRDMKRLNHHINEAKSVQSPSLYLSSVFLILGVVAVMAISAPSVLADAQVYEYVGPTGTVNLTNVPTDIRFKEFRSSPRYHRAVSDVELEQAVARAARQHGVSPALLLAVMKAESDFNPMAISKAGAVGLMQLIPETAIRHGVRNLYDTEDNIVGGAKHLRYLLDRFHGKLRLALAAYNAGEGNVDRYGKIPPYKETQLYVTKVMGYYREYKKGSWVIPVAITSSAAETKRPL
jgi:soluble lytic murein transglycosylase-like protein